jgi:Uma2 family endonuclease
MPAIADELLTKEELNARWKEVQDLYSDLSVGKIELDPYGNILMSPSAGEKHQTRADWIAQSLKLLFPSWTVLQNIGVLAGNAVLQPDVLAASWRRSESEDSHPFDPVPEICVEVISPSNRRPQIDQKLKRYLEAGAKEGWLCDRQNRMSFFSARGQIDRSELAPEFPLIIKLAIPPILKLQQENEKLQQELLAHERVILSSYNRLVRSPEDRLRLQKEDPELVSAYDAITTARTRDV